MAMKKTSGGDSPLRQGAGKRFWTLSIFGSTAAADRDVFWKSDWVFRFFRRGVFIGEWASSEWTEAVSHIGAQPSPWPRRSGVWGPRGPTPSPLRFSGSIGEILGDWLWFRQILRIFSV